MLQLHVKVSSVSILAICHIIRVSNRNPWHHVTRASTRYDSEISKEEISVTFDSCGAVPNVVVSVYASLCSVLQVNDQLDLEGAAKTGGALTMF